MVRSEGRKQLFSDRQSDVTVPINRQITLVLDLSNRNGRIVYKVVYLKNEVIEVFGLLELFSLRSPIPPAGRNIGGTSLVIQRVGLAPTRNRGRTFKSGKCGIGYNQCSTHLVFDGTRHNLL